MPGILPSTTLAQPSLQRLHEGLQMLREAHQQEGRSIDGLRLKARDLGDGRVMLYLKAGQPSRLSQLRNRLVGDDPLRRMLRQAMDPVLRDDAAWRTEDGQGAMLDLLRLGRRSGTPVLGTEVLGHLDRLQQARAQDDGEGETLADARTAWFAPALQSAQFRTLAQDLQGTLAHTDKARRRAAEDRFVTQLGQLLGRAMQDRPVHDQRSLLINDDHSIRQALFHALRRELSSHQMSRLSQSLQAGQSLQARLQPLLHDALVQARSGLADRVDGPLRSFRLAGGTTDYNAPEHIRLGGEPPAGGRFVFERGLAAGGFGVVCRYRSVDDPQRVIAVKVPNIFQTDSTLTEEARHERRAHLREVRAEVSAHWALAGAQPQHLVGLEGVIQMADGRVAIALEFAPHGDVHGLLQRLDASSTASPPDLRDAASGAGHALRLTLARDLLMGVAQMQAQGVSHLDLKGPNFLIDAQGRAKVCDFGLAQVADMRPFDSTAGAPDRPANPRWLDPRIGHLAAELSAQRAAATHEFDVQLKQLNTARKALIDQRGELRLHPATNETQAREQRAEIASLGTRIDALNAEFKRVEAQRTQLLAPWPSHVVVSGFNADKWSCATVIYELFTGKLPFDGDWNHDVTTQMQAFLDKSDPEQRAILFGSTPGVPSPVQDLIVDLMLATDRSAADILADPVFDAPEVGSDAIRQRIIELAQIPLD